jgi:hypothetical protein
LQETDIHGSGRHVTRGASLALIAGLTLALASCVPEPTADADDQLGSVSIDGYADVSATLDYATGTVALPMDPYSLQTPDVTTRVVRAIAEARDECLVERGFSAVAAEMDWTPGPPMENRRYGVWSVENASRYGFDLPPEVEQAVWAPDTTSLGVEFNKVYGECDSATRESLAEGLAFLSEPNIDWRIRDEAALRTLEHPDGKAAMTAWRSCMEQQGVVLDQDGSFPSEQYSRQGKESEIRVAVIQAECGASTRAVQTLFDLQARFEAAYLDTHAAAVAEFAKKREEVLASLDGATAP